tara:strand:+ start:1149 stop:1331 length:183 start_codon:yes stop_codon:yes gene_type:complete
MTVVQWLQNLLEDFGCHFLSEEFFFDDPIKKLSSCAQLCDQVNVLRVIEVFVEFEYVWVI